MKLYVGERLRSLMFLVFRESSIKMEKRSGLSELSWVSAVEGCPRDSTVYMSLLLTTGDQSEAYFV